MKTLSVRFADPLAVLLFALFAARCGGGTPSPIPIQPSVTLQSPAPPPAPGAQPAGRPIAVGEIVTAAITSDDTICRYPDPGDPEEELGGHCQQFVVTAPGDGTLGVQVAWDSASDFLFLAVDSHLYACCGSPLLARVRARGGSSYTLDVVRPGVTVGSRSMRFELKTWMDRN